MKYLKITLTVFLIAFLFSAVSVTASYVVNITNVKIPAFKGNYISGQKEKSDTGLQYIKKTKCTDDLTGDGLVILARTMGMLSGTYSETDFVEALPNTDVSLGVKSKTVQGYKLILQSNKKLVTTATFSGKWTLDK